MNLPDPTNHRISNSLFDAINKVRNGESAEPTQLDEATMLQDNGTIVHNCAKHVEHAEYGKGNTIAEEHADPDRNGDIAWYDIEFPHGVEKGVPVSELKILQIEAHMHPTKKMKKMTAEGNDGNLANNYPPYDKVTRGDVIAGRLGKDHMGGKKKDAKSMKEDVASGQVAEPKTPIEMPNKMHNANDSIKAKAMKKVAAAANKGVKEEAEEVAEARSTGTAFDMSTPSQIKKKPGELTGHSMKKSEAGGRIYTKTAPKMPQDTGVPKSKSMKEGISQTVINHNDFVLEVTDNPTYGDYLKALQSMINNSDEQIQQEIITFAQEAFNNKIESVIIEASSRATFKTKLQELRSSGAKVLDENYIVESGEPYVEYVVEQDGVRKQYVHSGTVKKV
jgi:hypothetical protein